MKAVAILQWKTGQSIKTCYVYRDNQIKEMKYTRFVRNTLLFLCVKSFNMHLRIWDTEIKLYILLERLSDFTAKCLCLHWNNRRASEIT